MLDLQWFHDVVGVQTSDAPLMYTVGTTIVTGLPSDAIRKLPAMQSRLITLL